MAPLYPPLPQSFPTAPFLISVCSHTPPSFLCLSAWAGINIKPLYQVPTLYISVSLPPALFSDLPLGHALGDVPRPSLSHGGPLPYFSLRPLQTCCPSLQASPAASLSANPSMTGCYKDLSERLFLCLHLKQWFSNRGLSKPRFISSDGAAGHVLGTAVNAPLSQVLQLKTCHQCIKSECTSDFHCWADLSLPVYTRVAAVWPYA